MVTGVQTCALPIWMGLLTAAVMIAVINYVIVGLLGGLLVDWLMEVSASRLLLIGAAIGLVIGVIDYRLSAARWNLYVAGLEVRIPTLPDREDLQST